MVLTALVDFLKVYLARAPATMAKVPDTVVKMPGGLRRTRLSWRNIHARLRAVFAKIFSLEAVPPKRRRAILIGSLLAAGISFLVGLGIVTAVELGVGKSLSCWLWEDCPAAESSEQGGQTSISTTLPSILGGGRSVPSGTPAVQPPAPQQSTPALPQQPPSRVPGVASQPESVQGSPEQQQPSFSQPSQQGSPSVVSGEGNQQPSTPEGSEAGKQPSGSEEPKQQDQNQRNQSSSGSEQQTLEWPFPSATWTT